MNGLEKKRAHGGGVTVALIITIPSLTWKVGPLVSLEMTRCVLFDLQRRETLRSMSSSLVGIYCRCNANDAPMYWLLDKNLSVAFWVG